MYLHAIMFIVEAQKINPSKKVVGLKPYCASLSAVPPLSQHDPRSHWYQFSYIFFSFWQMIIERTFASQGYNQFNSRASGNFFHSLRLQRQLRNFFGEAFCL